MSEDHPKHPEGQIHPQWRGRQKLNMNCAMSSLERIRKKISPNEPLDRLTWRAWSISLANTIMARGINRQEGNKKENDYNQVISFDGLHAIDQHLMRNQLRAGSWEAFLPALKVNIWYGYFFSFPKFCQTANHLRIV